MFDIGFSEMLVIAIVALVVIGPERLPRVARTAGHLLGRLQRYVSDVKSDINREMQLEELKKLQSEIRESARSVEQSLTTEMQAARQALDQIPATVANDISAPAALEYPTIAETPSTATGNPQPPAPTGPTLADAAQPTRTL